MQTDHRILWRALIHDLGHILGTSQACILLGSVLARPLYPMIRRECGIVPGVFLHGARASGKSYLANALASLFMPDPDALRIIAARNCNWRLFRNLMKEDASGIPLVVEEWADEPPSHNKVTDLCMSLGMDPSTTTPDGRIRFDTPLAILGQEPTRHPTLAGHCLHFTPHRGCRPVRYRPVSNLPDLHRLLDHLVAVLPDWEDETLGLIRASENKIAPHLRGRSGLLLRIAWSSFVASSARLDSESFSTGRELRHWLDKNAALFFPSPSIA